MNMTESYTGILIGDNGYISDELEFDLVDKGVKLITKTKDNMSFERVLTDEEKQALRSVASSR